LDIGFPLGMLMSIAEMHTKERLRQQACFLYVWCVQSNFATHNSEVFPSFKMENGAKNQTNASG